MSTSLDLVFLGLSITSSWGNGHATTYRGLIRELAARGHRVTFLERNLPWYEHNRDMPRPPYCATELYESLPELADRFGARVREADVVILGSYVPDGVKVAEWITTTARGVVGFYDIDTPVTLAKLDAGVEEYLSAAVVPRFDLYLSFTGGPTLEALRQRYGAARAVPLYCSVDPELYRPVDETVRWELGYLGTYCDDRQPKLDALLVEPARRRPEARFSVAGPQYPPELTWPGNVERFTHLSPREHPAFYCAQKLTVNITRCEMVRAGYSPSVRLFEAAACGTPILSDRWPGLDRFFVPGEEILLADSPEEVLRHLDELGDDERRRIGGRARARVLAEHTAAHRAETLERYTRESLDARALRARAKTIDLDASTP